MSNLPRIAGVLSYATLLLISILVISALVFLIMPDLARSFLLGSLPAGAPETAVTGPILYGVQAAAWVVLGVNLFVLWHIYCLSSLYAMRETLSDRCGHHVRRIGLGLILFPVVTTAYGALSSVLLSWHNPPGERELVLAINVQGLGFAIGGALLLLIGTTIRHATAIAEENRSFV
ncbi:hypothetical protein [Aestuariivita boseongensis]|uniref:hypothetical protein n=1 Tax=Aestuariivita boseongensis TaxID=1470562 RepID=UPI000680DE0D|nr:hypothetical protein [Aestuariivita boseongensis]